MRTNFKNIVLALLSLGAIFSIGVVTKGQHAGGNPNGFTEKEVRFGNSGFTLSGTVISPLRSGKHPALVFLHGSSPLTRNGHRTYAIEYAKLGFVSLVFDRRGAGKSEGNRFATSLREMADDAVNGIALLKTHENVDPDRIGFWAISQGGWVATLAAANSKDVAFMIVVSGGGASPRESEIYSYLGRFRRAGLSANEVLEGMQAIRKFFKYLETGLGFDELQTLVSTSKEKAWYKHAQIGNIIPGKETRPKWQWVAKFETKALIEQITCPVLLMFGDRDKDHPTDLSVKKWREGLSRAGNDDVSIVVFPGAGHGIRMRDDYSGNGRAPFADGYFEVMAGWLWQHVLVAKE